MAANTSPIFVDNVTGKGTTWTSADAANTKKIISPTIGADGARIHSVGITSTDTAAKDFAFYLNDGSNDYLIGTIAIPITAGFTNAIAAISVLTQGVLIPWLSPDASLLIPAGWSLKAENLAALTAAKTITVVTLGGDY